MYILKCILNMINFAFINKKIQKHGSKSAYNKFVWIFFIIFFNFPLFKDKNVMIKGKWHLRCKVSIRMIVFLY